MGLNRYCIARRGREGLRRHRFFGGRAAGLSGKSTRRAAFPSRDPSPFLTRVNSRTPRRQRLLDLLASVYMTLAGGEARLKSELFSLTSALQLLSSLVAKPQSATQPMQD